jgi:hypothetical protein
MKTIRIVLALALAGFSVACTGSRTDSANVDAASERAKQAADRLTGSLLGELTAAMKEGGPIGAIRYCSRNAQDLTASIADEMQLSVRRVTIKPRNQVNIPDEWEQQRLNDFDSMARRGELGPDAMYREVATMDGRLVLRWMRPIVIRQPCLVCHGTDHDIPGDVAKLLRDNYASDQATGYVVGDFRGGISVTIPLE